MTCIGIFACKLAIAAECDTQKTIEAKMITKIIPDRNKALTDRQTDRQTDRLIDRLTD